MRPFIAVDWGTTNRRAFLVADGVVQRTERDGQGAAAMQGSDYPAAIAGLRERLGDLPVLIAGMAGSTIGWHEVPYRPVPAGLDTIGAGLHFIDARTAIVPGVSQLAPHPDVMRGEELQLLGAVAAGLVPRDAIVCQPGTHCKWVHIEGGRIVRFTTSMTGELFGLLRSHSLLAPQLADSDGATDGFAEGVFAGARRDLAATLFGIRARHVLRESDGVGAGFASGVMIGADVAARLAEFDGDVFVLADGALAGAYCEAIGLLGAKASAVDSHTAFVAGGIYLAEKLQ
jgi:2-dehydro-3-deoxygalactonokinase